MLSEKMNSVLTDVTPGSPMHQAMSRYWLPAFLSRDMPEPDSEPMRVTLLGKTFVAFRDSAGRVGLLDEHCCHRAASLCLGRVEEGGIRCLYHGWKFDVDGVALDTPNVSDERVRSKIRQPSYPVKEAGGIVWAYIGPGDKEPPLPDEGFFHVPVENVFVEIVVFPTNFTRAMEGVLDNTHVAILHKDSAPPDTSAQLAPRLELQETEYGFRYAILREHRAENGEVYDAARITSFTFPSHVYQTSDRRMLIPDEAKEVFMTRSERKTVFRSVAISVPITNDVTHHYVVWWDPDHALGVGEEEQRFRKYFGLEIEELRRTGMSREGFANRPRIEDSYGQNRAAMKRGETFTGFYPFFQEDWAVVASMGPIAGRPQEQLMHSDIAVSAYRRLLIENALAVQKGHEPVGIDLKRRPYSIACTVERHEDWREFFDDGPSTRAPVVKVPETAES